jgi:hypothetical protein
MEPFTYKFTDLLNFSSPSMDLLPAPAEILEFASTLAQQMLAAQPDLVDKGICVAVYDSGGTAVSMVPLGTTQQLPPKYPL